MSTGWVFKEIVLGGYIGPVIKRAGPLLKFFDYRKISVYILTDGLQGQHSAYVNKAPVVFKILRSSNIVNNGVSNC